MILLNFSHPITTDQIERIELLSGQTVDRLIDLPVQFDSDAPFLPQLETLTEQIPLSPRELQTMSILINLPSLNFIAGLLLADLHGRMGYFPPILRTRLISDSLPSRYEVAEILNLQVVREHSRTTRHQSNGGSLE